MRKGKKNPSFEDIIRLNNNSEEYLEKLLKMPIYFISTRDSFAFDLVEKITTHLRAETNTYYQRIEYFFEEDNLPTNYGPEYRKLFPELNVGVISYHNFFTHQELTHFEN